MIYYSIIQYTLLSYLQCSSRSRQETQLLRHAYKSDMFLDNLQDGNIWSYPYTPCNEENIVSYLNKYEVWNAFHVNISWMEWSNQSWSVCSDNFYGYDVNETDDATDQVVYIKDVLQSKCVRILIYSGNNDLVCSMAGSRYWIYGKLNESDTGQSIRNWTQWHVNGEVGGWYEQWEKFTFLVVRDAGHEVPEYQPVRAYSMFQRFLANDYSDIPVFVRHTGWNNYNDDDDDDEEHRNLIFVGMGIAIGAGLCLLMFLIIVGCVWLKNKKYGKRVFELYEAKKAEDYHKHVMLENEAIN